MSSQNESIFTTIACSISSLSSATFLLCFIRYEALRQKVSMNLIAIFQFFDIILSINKLIPVYLFKSPKWMCRFLGFIEQFFTINGLILISWFSLFVYRKICLNKDQSDAINLKKVILITVSASFTIAAILGCLDLYKQADYWCWIDVGVGMKEFFMKEFLTYYVFLFISCGWGSFVTWKVYKLVHHNIQNIDWQIFRLQAYPPIIFFAYIFLFISRLAEAADYKLPQSYGIFAAFIINLIGFINFVVLGFTKEFRSALKFKIGESTLLEMS